MEWQAQFEGSNSRVRGTNGAVALKLWQSQICLWISLKFHLSACPLLKLAPSLKPCSHHIIHHIHLVLASRFCGGLHNAREDE